MVDVIVRMAPMKQVQGVEDMHFMERNEVKFREVPQVRLKMVNRELLHNKFLLHFDLKKVFHTA